MAVTTATINDLLTATLFADKKGQISDINPSLLTDYIADRMLVSKNKEMVQTGRDFRWTVNVEGVDTSEFIGFYHTVGARSEGDSLKQATMRAKLLFDRMVFDEQEIDFNAPPLQIVDYVKNREQQHLIGMVAKRESRFWGNADSTDNLGSQGVLYWLPYCASQGFVGTYPSGYSDIAGLDPTTYTGWKSYGDVYVNVVKADAVLKLRRALSATQFMAPLKNMLVQEHATGYDISIYINLDTELELEDRLSEQNDNLGKDIDSFHNMCRIRGIPFVRAPFLDANTRDPFIGINWNQWRKMVQKGWSPRRQKMPPNANQPLVAGVDYFESSQPIVFNRARAGFNIAKAA